MKAKTKSVITTLSLLGFLILPTTAAYAGTQTDATSTAGATDKCASNSFFPAWYANGLCKDGEIVSPASFDKNDTAGSFGKWLTILAINLVTMLLYVVGYVSLGFIIYGGFKYMTSGDSSGGTVAARKTIQNAVIGLVLSIMSVAIVTFVAGAIK